MSKSIKQKGTTKGKVKHISIFSKS